MLFGYVSGYWHCLIDAFWFKEESVNDKYTKNGQKLLKIAILHFKVICYAEPLYCLNTFCTIKLYLAISFAIISNIEVDKMALCLVSHLANIYCAAAFALRMGNFLRLGGGVTL